VSIGVQVSPRELANVNGWFSDIDKSQARDNRRALLKAGKKAVSLSVKELAGLLRVKQKPLRRRIKAFPAPRRALGLGDFVRVWAGLAVRIDAKDNPKILADFPKAFKATMPNGGSGFFSRRPNPLKQSPRSTHANPTRGGRPNPGRHGLPIDKVSAPLRRERAEPIIFRHARAAAVTIYPAEFLRLLEVSAQRAARKRS